MDEFKVSFDFMSETDDRIGIIKKNSVNIMMVVFIACCQNRIAKRLQVDRKTCPYNAEMLQDRKAICRNMLTNPFEKFERKRFLYYSKDLGVISVNHALLSQMENADWEKVKNQMQDDLKNYYAEMGGI